MTRPVRACHSATLSAREVRLTAIRSTQTTARSRARTRRESARRPAESDRKVTPSAFRALRDRQLGARPAFTRRSYRCDVRAQFHARECMHAPLRSSSLAPARDGSCCLRVNSGRLFDRLAVRLSNRRVSDVDRCTTLESSITTATPRARGHYGPTARTRSPRARQHEQSANPEPPPM
jgi:hypothetical protein